MTAADKPMLEIKGLKKYFHSGQKIVRAVDGVDLAIRPGETFGLVGESGCGKSTTGRCILRLVEPTEGSVRFNDSDVLAANKQQLRNLRQRMQIIFQDPYSSLDPRMTVRQIIEEPLVIHKRGSQSERADRVAELLRVVGLSSDLGKRYPHQFSGGQRQRIGIARALALNPAFIVCDEPVSALDVSVQAQVINLLQDLQAQFGLTYLFISHGLAVVRHIANRVAIMYAGKIVEVAESSELFDNPLHPYTRALLSAIPEPDPDAARIRRRELEKRTDSVEIPAAGCSFLSRCPESIAECGSNVPVLREVTKGHFVSCFAASPVAR